MSWIKRNLFFLIGSVVALVLMGLAGWFLYSKWNLNNENLTKLNADYEKLRNLAIRNPHPGDKKVDNILNAKNQQKQLSNYVHTARAYFVPMARIPSAEDAPKVTDHDYTTSLSRTIDQLQKEASAASVSLPATNYNFSFEAQKQKVSFDPAGLLPLSIQLGEVREICTVLFQAKVNALDNIRRERVSKEDSLGGLQTDYLTEKKTTNELAVLTPYEVVFKCFSSELAAVLAGFASSSHGMIVKTINVEAAPVTAGGEPTNPILPTGTLFQYTQPVMPQTGYSIDDSQARMRARYGLGGSRYGGGAGGGYGGGGYSGGVQDQGGVQYRGIQPTQPAYQPTYPQPVAASASTASKSGGLPTVLDERQLKVTVNLILVKLLPPK